MSRTTSLALLCLSLFLIVFPLVLEKPGWPAGLKSDEPAYYLMAMSLARDGDLRCELPDVRRLFREFPYHPVQNLILATDDGWRTVYYGKPYLYSLFAAPAAALFGASGMVAFNMALLMLMVWLGTRYLARHNPGGVALLFSAGFFFLSCGTAYVFWIHPEIFNMAAVTVSLYLGLADADRHHHRRTRRALLAAAGSGAALMLAVYNKPMLLALCLPVLFAYLWRRDFRRAGAWIGGAAVSMAVVVGLAVALTGHPSAYFLARGGQKVCSPDEVPIPATAPVLQEAEVDAAPAVAPEEPAEGAEAESAETESAETAEVEEKKPPKASWYWIFRIPRPHPLAVTENLGYFLWGRHTGLFLYFPFSLLALGLFLFFARRSPMRWVLLGSLAVVALFFLLWIPFNWQGGGGFIGNRYFVNAYPGFLFLVTRVAPRGLLAVGYAVGGLLLGPILFTPLGRAVPAPTLQAHVRNFPFTLFPLELSLREVPGYQERVMVGALVRGRDDVFLPRGARFWVHGATTTEIWIQTVEPMERLAFLVGSPAVPNEVVLRVGEAEERLVFDGTGPPFRRVELEPGEPDRVRRVQWQPVYVYRLEVAAATGEPRPWTRRFPPQVCPEFGYNETLEETFFLGAEMSFLGSGAALDRDLYAVRWGKIRVPPRVAAGERFEIRTRVQNASEHPWPVEPPVRVGLSYRWLDEAGRVVVENGLRTHPEAPVPPGEMLVIDQEIEAPEAPGRYVLTLDLVYELVAWFSSRNGGEVFRAPVEVVPAEDGAGP